jgi:putative metallohydrolase (TIGR04338 family)
MSDHGRTAAYAGEHRLRAVLEWSCAGETPPAVEIAGSTLTLPIERRFGDLASIQRYCDKVLALPQYAHAGPVSVRERRGDGAAHYSPSRREIAVCTTGLRWALREAVVLHELAHHLSPNDPNGHGLVWRNTFLDLLETCMGPEVAFFLRVTWWSEGVALAA